MCESCLVVSSSLVSSPSLLQGIFPTQGSNPGLPHCRQILYCLSHQRSPANGDRYIYINGVTTDTSGCMKMVMTTAISVATANDEAVGLALYLLFFLSKTKRTPPFLPQHKGLHPFPGKMIKSHLHILRGFIISCGNKHEPIGHSTACLKYECISGKDSVVVLDMRLYIKSTLH